MESDLEKQSFKNLKLKTKLRKKNLIELDLIQTMAEICAVIVTCVSAILHKIATTENVSQCSAAVKKKCIQVN
jgi:hypothetical protein